MTPLRLPIEARQWTRPTKEAQGDTLDALGRSYIIRGLQFVNMEHVLEAEQTQPRTANQLPSSALREVLPVRVEAPS